MNSGNSAKSIMRLGHSVPNVDNCVTWNLLKVPRPSAFIREDPIFLSRTHLRHRFSEASTVSRGHHSYV